MNYVPSSALCSSLKLRRMASQQIENKLHEFQRSGEVTSGAILKFNVRKNSPLRMQYACLAPPVGPPPPIPNSFRGQTAPKRPDEMLFECVIWSRRFRTSAASASADCINGIIPGKAQFPKISCISRIQSCWTTLHLLSRLLLDHPVPI